MMLKSTVHLNVTFRLAPEPELFNQERYHLKSKSQENSEKIIGIDLHPDSFSLAVMAPAKGEGFRVVQQITQESTSNWRTCLNKLSQPAVLVCETSGNSFEMRKNGKRLVFHMAHVWQQTRNL